MFILNKKNCIRLSEFERKNAINILKKLKTPVDISNFKFYWCSDMNSQNGVLGCFSYRHPDSLFLMPPVDVGIGTAELLKAHIKLIAPTIIHELTHMKQYKEKGKLKYSLYAIPFLREILLEKEARANERFAEIELNNITI